MGATHCFYPDTTPTLTQYISHFRTPVLVQQGDPTAQYDMVSVQHYASTSDVCLQTDNVQSNLRISSIALLVDLLTIFPVFVFDSSANTDHSTHQPIPSHVWRVVIKECW